MKLLIGLLSAVLVSLLITPHLTNVPMIINVIIGMFIGISMMSITIYIYNLIEVLKQ